MIKLIVRVIKPGLEKKLDVLTKIAGGALIVSVLTAGGVLLWKLFGKKDGGNEKSQAVNKKKVGERLHARSWNDGGNEFCVRSIWDGNILDLRDLTNLVQSNERNSMTFLNCSLKL